MEPGRIQTILLSNSITFALAASSQQASRGQKMLRSASTSTAKRTNGSQSQQRRLQLHKLSAHHLHSTSTSTSRLSGTATQLASHTHQPQQHQQRLASFQAAANDFTNTYEGATSTAGFIMAESGMSDEMSAADIKAALLDSMYGTERGLAARSEIRAEINELITQLEAKNPTPSPTDMLMLLDGNWKLVYTSNSELLAILALSRLPLVTIGDITQRIDSATNTVENKVAISVPLSRTSLSTTASFEVRSPKRLQVRFEKGAIQTPELLADVEVPESVSILGQTLDLSQVRSVLQPVSQGLSGIISQVGNILSQSPDLSFPLPNSERSQTWLLTTYLDEDTRITRGDGGSVFILVKDVSLSSAPPPPLTADQEAVAEAMML